jgi:hypothetical protein
MSHGSSICSCCWRYIIATSTTERLAVSVSTSAPQPIISDTQRHTSLLHAGPVASQYLNHVIQKGETRRLAHTQAQRVCKTPYSRQQLLVQQQLGGVVRWLPP